MACWRQLQRARGFTLVELVVVIVLLGIVAVSTTQFIRQGVEIYRDTARRDSLQQDGRFVVERIIRELRNALPGSVRASANCLEFMPIVGASSYINNITGADITSFQAADFSFSGCDSAAICDFTGGGYRVAVYTIDNGDVYFVPPPAPPQTAVLNSINAVAAGIRTVNLVTTRFTRESPQNRFFIIKNRVSFCAVDGAMTRYSGYTTATSTQPIPPVGGSSSLLSESIRVVDASSAPITVFSFTPGILQRAGVVHMDMQFHDISAADEWVRFSHEVFVRNTP
ncbi:MAG: prepilin-type N-terminal cleavage/methylation domain-containing protein [Pseudomonadales bacterium]